MDGIYLWLLFGCAGLLAVAIAVACWEHLAQTMRPRDDFASAPVRAVSIDVEIEAPAAVAAASEAERRREALDVALVRMAQPAAEEVGSWDITTPMVGPGPRAEDFGAPAVRGEAAPHTVA